MQKGGKDFFVFSSKIDTFKAEFAQDFSNFTCVDQIVERSIFPRGWAAFATRHQTSYRYLK